MLKYKINKNIIDSTTEVLPIQIHSIIDYDNLKDDDGTSLYKEGNLKHKKNVFCYYENVKLLGNDLKVMHKLFVNSGNGFNDETNNIYQKYTIDNLDENDSSFSFLVDKYVPLKLKSITIEEDENYIPRLIITCESKHYQKIETSFGDNLDDVEGVFICFLFDNEEFFIRAQVYDDYTFRCKVSDLKEDVIGNKIYRSVFNTNDDVRFSYGRISGVKLMVETPFFGDYDNFTFYQEKRMLKVEIPFSNSFETDLLKNDIIKNKFIDVEKKKAINKIVDLEKDVYLPCKKNKNNIVFLNKLKFNFHFREHRGKNWISDENSFWNGVEIKDGKAVINENITRDDVSDLLTYLNFNNDDVHYQKNKLKKSFIRVNYYDSNNPLTQNLLGYSTIFVDSGNLFSKYIKYNEKPDYLNITYSKDDYSIYTIPKEKDKRIKDGIRVNREPLIKDKNSFDEEYRLSSQISVCDKNLSKSSSEGFYVYLWKDNHSCLEQDLYVRIEYNHAGYGRSIPFMLPYWDVKKWEDKKNKDTKIKTFKEILDDWNDEKEIVDNNVRWKNNTDGHYSLKQYVKYSFIHFKYRYDKELDKHIYYLDEETYGNIDEKSKADELTINLYEAKVE